MVYRPSPPGVPPLPECLSHGHTREVCRPADVTGLFCTKCGGWYKLASEGDRVEPPVGWQDRGDS